MLRWWAKSSSYQPLNKKIDIRHSNFWTHFWINPYKNRGLGKRLLDPPPLRDRDPDSSVQIARSYHRGCLRHQCRYVELRLYDFRDAHRRLLVSAQEGNFYSITRMLFIQRMKIIWLKWPNCSRSSPKGSHFLAVSQKLLILF